MLVTIFMFMDRIIGIFVVIIIIMISVSKTFLYN